MISPILIPARQEISKLARGMCLLGFAWATMVAQQTEVAYVADIEGHWTLDQRDGRLSRGEGLPDEGVIRFAGEPGSEPTPRILVMDLHGNKFGLRECIGRRCIVRPLVLGVPGDQGALPTVSTVFRLVMRALLKGSPPKHIATISRGKVTDGIAWFDGNSLKLEERLEETLNSMLDKPPDLAILLEPIVFGNDQATIAEFSLIRTDSQWTLTPMPSRGLYHLVAGDRSGPEAEGWIMITTPERGFELVERLKSLRNELNAWGSEEEKARRIFLRGYLLAELQKDRSVE